ncbi:hypothetical protein PSTT_01820 [Puccinia striiformis]|uniref:Ferroxidase n=1 Tax=Puccinia striiformis TaxID=27350 RepID=A0A2S4W293_9BASI|nr:hypothetical protein PSTT_01820 [Puccinia striiformis]
MAAWFVAERVGWAALVDHEPTRTETVGGGMEEAGIRLQENLLDIIITHSIGPDSSRVPSNRRSDLRPSHRITRDTRRIRPSSSHWLGCRLFRKLDIPSSVGVMNFSMGDHGTYVINKQPPNKQIWLSSPFSGPKRFDYDRIRKIWFYNRVGNLEFMHLMSSEIDSILADNSFSKLYLSSNHHDHHQ